MLHLLQTHVNNASFFGYSDEERISAFYQALRILESNNDPKSKEAFNNLLKYHPNKDFMEDNLYVELEDILSSEDQHYDLDEIKEEFYDLSGSLDFLGSDDVLKPLR